MKTFFSKNDRFKNLFVRLYKKDTTGSEWFFLLNFPFLVPTIWNDKVFRYKKKKKKIRSIYWFQNLFYSSILNYAHFIVSKAVDQNIC